MVRERTRSRRLLLGVAYLAVMAAVVPVAAAAGGRGAAEPTFGESVGVNTHYGAGRETVSVGAVQRLHAAGVHFLRNDLGWSAIESERGVYDFAGSGMDDFVAAAEAAGLHVLFILDYGNPLYGEANAVVSDEEREAFAAFAFAAAQHYGGRGHMWEIWNEPNLPQFWSGNGILPDAAVYAQLVAATVPALRAADPGGAILVGAAFTGLPDLVPLLGGVEGVDFLQQLFATGVLASVDGVTAHFYRADPPESVGTTVERIRQAMQDAGGVVPLWSGEWGYSTYDPDAPPTGLNFIPAVSEARQASYAARMMLNDYALGLQGSVWFKDRDAANPDPGDIEQHWGLMHDDLTAKPSYEALATATALLGDAVGTSALPLPAGQHGLEFQTAAGRVVALWAESDVLWHLQADDPESRVLARDGSEITLPTLARGAQLRVASDDGPLYLLGDVAVLPPSLCAGDCDGDGAVQVDELVTGVGISLDAAAPAACAVLDADTDGTIAITELVGAVGNALHGC